jgi:diacylglycerol O-acyltransferase
VVSGSADLAKSAGSAAMAVPGKLPRLGRADLEEGFGLLTSPTRLTDALSTVAAEDNQLVNAFRSVSRLSLAGRSVDTVWSGKPQVDKHVSWITGIELDRVREIGAQHGVTINDSLLAAVSAGVTRYLREKGAQDVDQVNWLIPVSLKPVDGDLPEELGNHFAIVMLPMPLGIDDPGDLLAAVHSRMMRIKNSPEALLLFGVQRVIAEAPRTVSTQITNWVANKSVGILTNVPGPRAPMYLAGSKVAGVLGWVPTSGDQPLGVCIFSYNGLVNIGIASDAVLIPDPDRLAELVREEFDLLHEDATGG